MKRSKKQKRWQRVKPRQRVSTERKLATGLENLERRALLTGVTGLFDACDYEPPAAEERVVLKKEVLARKDQIVGQKPMWKLKKQLLREGTKKDLVEGPENSRPVIAESAGVPRGTSEIPEGTDVHAPLYAPPALTGDYRIVIRYPSFYSATLPYEGTLDVEVLNEGVDHETAVGDGGSVIHTINNGSQTVVIVIGKDGSVKQGFVSSGDQTSSNGNETTGNGNDTTGNDTTGNDTTGNDTTGNDNTGNDTTGNDNNGNGDDNTGNDTTGNDNNGNGDDNTGNDTTGNDNTGNGDDNSGNSTPPNNEGTYQDGSDTGDEIPEVTPPAEAPGEELDPDDPPMTQGPDDGEDEDGGDDDDDDDEEDDEEEEEEEEEESSSD